MASEKNYTETFENLYHGTDEKSAEAILSFGFEIRGDDGSWCGKGVYFYDIKRKAWWSANRTCDRIKKCTGIRVKPALIVADIPTIKKADIFDLRTIEDIQDFEKTISSLFDGRNSFQIDGVEETERIIQLRSMFISYYAEEKGKKLIIGCFRQRPQPKYEHAIEFSNKLNMVFGIETIYCVKDKSIIRSIRRGGEMYEAH